MNTRGRVLLFFVSEGGICCQCHLNIRKIFNSKKPSSQMHVLYQFTYSAMRQLTTQRMMKRNCMFQKGKLAVRVFT